MVYEAPKKVPSHTRSRQKRMGANVGLCQLLVSLCRLRVGLCQAERRKVRIISSDDEDGEDVWAPEDENAKSSEIDIGQWVIAKFVFKERINYYLAQITGMFEGEFEFEFYREVSIVTCFSKDPGKRNPPWKHYCRVIRKSKDWHNVWFQGKNDV